MSNPPRNNKFELSVAAPRRVGYIDCVLRTPVEFSIVNRGTESLAAVLVAESREGLILRDEENVTLLPGVSVKVTVPGLFSPLFLSRGGEVRRAAVSARLFVGGKEVCCGAAEVEALPYGTWEGLSGNAERLAAFVCPGTQAAARVLADALHGEKTGEGEKIGDTGTKKERAHRILGAVFSVLKRYAPVRTPQFDARAPVAAQGEAVAMHLPVNPLQAGVFACSCLEAAGLDPVLAVGARRVGVGVWLYDTSLLSPSTDDSAVIAEYLCGAKSLAFFDADDCFAGGAASLAASGRRFLRGLREGEYSCFADIGRCRKEGILPCSGVSERGAEGGGAADAPAEAFRGRQWEKRLLDFSARNRLLHFTETRTLRVACADPDALATALSAEEGMRLVAGEECAAGEAERMQTVMEEEKNILRVYAGEDGAEEEAGRLFRAGRAAKAETGAGVIYLSFGLMHFSAGGERYRAPVALLPADLSRAETGGYALRAEGAFFLNSTLFEYLKIKDVEGTLLSERAFSTLQSALSCVKEACKLRGWHVTDEVFLGIFTFRNYFLWHDLRSNFGEFCKNRNVLALLRGRLPAPSAPPAPLPIRAVLPLPSDRSQDEAVALSETGATFVLHGPPGTGKSQTIANMIACALQGGKRVLFVAEKKAALDVVKRRLDRIGVGDFCLELVADRAEKTEIANKIDKTLSLSAEISRENALASHEYEALSARLEARLCALNERTKAGVSVREAIAASLRYGDTAEFAGGSPSFYAGLDAEHIALCRHMLADAEETARRCVALRGAPFEHVGIPYSDAARERILCACRALLLAEKHLRESMELLLGFYGQRAPVLTETRLRAMLRLARELPAREPCFCGVTAEELGAFCEAEETVRTKTALFLRSFRTVAQPDDEDELLRYAEEGGDWRLSRSLRATAKRLSRAARQQISEEDIPKYLKTLSEIVKNTRKAEEIFSHTRGRGEGREAYADGLFALHALCGEAFGQFEAKAFHAACVRASNGCARPILDGFCSAAEAFLAAFTAFCAATGTERESVGGEDLLAYSAEKAAALLDHIDMLRDWCRSLETMRRLEKEGMGAVFSALRGGTSDAVASFEKGIYRRLVEERVSLDERLAGDGSRPLELLTEKLNAAEGAQREQICKTLRDFLISRLPSADDPTYYAARAALGRAARGKGSRAGVRGFLAEIDALLARACPCLLMSPSAAAQYLQPQANAFDLVVFDEASQMSTAEAVGCIARAKSAVVVGDPNQLPPTEFFRAARPGEEEDAESVLDDFLALGVPERRLIWHYRSRHESLITFSNAAFYGNALRTVPSPDAAVSRVRLVRVAGVYDRGGSKRNRAEAEALVGEVVRRLEDAELSRKSMGVVALSVAQRDEIERLLARALSEHGLERAAYDRDEPLFVKNLENVQGDERDVILFSVCYGADAEGKLSLNFGPLNKTGGWRRLNVAASRARDEMLVYASFPSAAIDAGRTASRGVLALKEFLEFAETGKTQLVSAVRERENPSVGEHLARALKRCGYTCVRGVGASGCKVDIAVADPREKKRYLLAVLLDDDVRSVKDDVLLKERLLVRSGWQVMRVSSVGYYADPARELERIKRALDGLTGVPAHKPRYKRVYRSVAQTARQTAAFISGAENAEEICTRLMEIVAREQPISRAFLKKRCLDSYGVSARGAKISAVLDRLIARCAFPCDRVCGVDYLYRTPRALSFTRYRTEGKKPLRREAEDFTVYEVVSMVRGALEEHVVLYADEVGALFEREFHAARAEGELSAFLMRCVAYGEEKGLFRRSASDRLTLA